MGYDAFGNPLIPGRNVDRVSIGAGMQELRACGYEANLERDMVIVYALQRWRRGEEEAAERGAIDQTFHGIDFTSWRRVLAAAVSSPVVTAPADRVADGAEHEQDRGDDQNDHADSPEDADVQEVAK